MLSFIIHLNHGATQHTEANTHVDPNTLNCNLILRLICHSIDSILCRSFLQVTVGVYAFPLV